MLVSRFGALKFEDSEGGGVAVQFVQHPLPFGTKFSHTVSLGDFDFFSVIITGNFTANYSRGNQLL